MSKKISLRSQPPSRGRRPEDGAVRPAHDGAQSGYTLLCNKNKQDDIIRIGLYGTNGHQLPTELPIRARVVAVADYPPDGLDKSIRVYDTSNLGEIKHLARGHQVPVKRLAFSRDGVYLASAGENGKILLWNWPARRVVGSVPPSDSAHPIYDAFDFPTAEPLLLVHEAGGSSVISVPDARRLQPGSPVPEALRRWLVSTNQVQFPYDTEPALASLRTCR